MDKTFTRYPLDEYLERGISAAQTIDILQQRDCLTFPQLRSGLFPAAIFDSPDEDETGMTNAWLRDSSCVGLVLLKTDQHEAAIRAVKGIIACLQTIRQSFEDNTQRPPVRFTGQDSEPLYEWANSQNDALGYSLQYIGEAVKNHAFEIDQKAQEIIDSVVTYLETVEYWNDADSGHWEEIKKVNASSIGTVIAGLRSVREIASDETKVAALIEKGNEALGTILPNESITLGAERVSDSALVFLVEPQQVVSGDSAAQIITDAQHDLMGEYGFRRYVGDSYWGPNYREHFQLGGRTADFSDPKNMALRDGYLTPGDEAQWTLVDPMMAAYYAHRYQKSGASEDYEQSKRFMVRSLRSIVSYKKEGSEEVVWRIPELYFLENNVWVPNDHMGLLWAQANLLYGLMAYQEVFGELPINLEESLLS